MLGGGVIPDKIFPNGLIFKLPNDNAPDYVKGKLSIKTEEFITFLRDHEYENGWVSIDLLVSQQGKAYAAMNTWKPDRLNERGSDQQAEKENRKEDMGTLRPQNMEQGNRNAAPFEMFKPDDAPDLLGDDNIPF